MQKKHNALVLIMGLLAMVFTGYALFVTVFNQIISQNEGFFYAIVFGGILILLYIFINIICKLLVISDSMRNSKVFKLINILFVLALCAVFVFSRISYTSSVSPMESTFYNSAVLINNESLAASGSLTSRLATNPAQYVLALIYSVLLQFVPESNNIAIIVNIVFCCISSILVYLISSKFTDNVCAVIAVAISLFSPGQLYSVYSYSTDCMMAMFFLMHVFMLVRLIFAETKGSKVLFGILYALFTAVLLLCEPTFLVLVLFTIILVPITKRKSAKVVLLASLGALLIFAGLLFLKAYHLETSYGECIGATLNCFLNSTDSNTGSTKNFSDIKSSFDSYICSDDRPINNNYNFLTKSTGESISMLSAAWITLANQMIFMFVLVLCISAIIFSLQYRDNRFSCLFAMIISSFVTLFFASGREVNTYFYHSILAILSSCGLFYIYLNHHKEEANRFRNILWSESSPESEAEKIIISEEELKENAERERMAFLERAKALIFVGENNYLYNLIKSEEHNEKYAEDSDVISGSEESSYGETFAVNEVAAFEESFAVDEVTSFEGTTTVDEVVASDEVFEDSNALGEDSNIQGGEEMPMNDLAEEVYTDELAEVVPTDEFVQSEPREVTYLPNPLPVPDRRPHVEMDFDQGISDDMEWDYAINGPEFEDFDY